MIEYKPMNKRMLNLALRRQCLTLDAATQRAQLAQVVDTWRAPLALVDGGLEVLRFTKKHPIWMVGVSAALLKVVRLNHVGKWLQRGLVAWQILGRLNSKN